MKRTFLVPLDAPRSATSSDQPDWLIVGTLLSGTFMAVLDFFIVNVAIPALQYELMATPAQIQFIVAGYALAYGSALIIGSRIGDIYGRSRIFILGLLLFTLSSAACGIAPDAAVIVVARILQGLSSALMAPQILAILSSTYSGTAKARALNAYGFCMGLASVLGQIVGGLLISLNLFGWNWRTCFLINVPIGLIAVLVAMRVVPESRAPERPRLDLVGMTLITAALFALAYPLIQGRQEGWPAWSWLSIALSMVLFLLFGLFEDRAKRAGILPLIDFGLFDDRSFSVGLLAQLVFYMSMAAFYLVFAIYMQEGRGLSALQAGLLFAANGLGYLASSSVARLVGERLGTRVIALAGILRAMGLGILLLAVSGLESSDSALCIVPGLFINGLGTGFAVAPLAANVMTRMPAQHAGAASGVLTTVLQIGNAIGVAIIGAIFYGALTPLSASSYAHAFALSLAFLICCCPRSERDRAISAR